MSINEYIEKLEPVVSNMFEVECSGHGIDHLERTLKNALYIQSKEGGNPIIIGISAYLHDLHRLMQYKDGKYHSPKESLNKVKRILKNIDLSNEEKKEICYCIENHEKYNWNDNNVDDINTLILQDADNLDAIGAIGIARAFAYGSANGIPIYSENFKRIVNDNYVESDNLESSTIQHFYDKLLKLGDNMNTKTAKNIAKKRAQFIKEYINEFMNEVNIIETNCNDKHIK
ncbi:MAG: HD domain-containing protein [Bacilli bacterium]